MGKLDDVARDRLRLWLGASEKTQASLATEIGRNQAWMTRYLDGQFDADLDTLQRIAVAFENTLACLLSLPGETMDAEVLELFHALRPKGRDLALELLRDWTSPRAKPRRSPSSRG